MEFPPAGLSDNDGRLPSGTSELEQGLEREKVKTGKAREDEESFRLLVASVKDYAIFILDPNGIVSSWNAGAERIKGYRAEEIVGQHFSRFYPPEDLAWGKPEWELEEAIKEGRLEDEGWRIRKDGSRFWANVVITALYDQSGELRGFAKVTRDMSERKRSDEKIRQANAELEERVRERTAELEAANRAKDELLKREQEARIMAEKAVNDREEFLSVAAHELKTPITSLQGYAQLIKSRLKKEGELDTARLLKMVEAFATQTEKLNRLVFRLLDVSRLRSGKLVLELEKADLVELVQNVAESARNRTDRHEIRVVAPPCLIALVDPLRLEQVLTNLVDNAIKFSPLGGPVEISLTLVEPEGVLLAVQDWGVGIASSEISSIFEPFYQGNQASFSGLGMGLYISRQIVELHGGRIGVEFPERMGTRFVVKIPGGNYAV